MATNELAHSPLGPSSAERWLSCPASVRATKGLPDTDSPYAIEGTACHTVSEWCRRDDEPAALYAGTKIPVKKVDGTLTYVEFTQDLVNAVQEFLDYVNSFDGEHLNESRVYYDKYVPDGFGTMDHATLSVGLARVTDLKAGQGVQVFAEWNEQLMLYALGILLEWDWLYCFEEFILTIHQPRLDHVDSWTISKADLLKWAEEVLVPGYKRTLDPNAKFNPGSWCQFCKLRSTCRARTAAMFTVLQGEFENLDELAPTPPDEITLDQCAAIHKRFPELKTWMAAVRERLVEAIRAGKTAGDAKLVAGRSSREFVGDNKEVVNALAKAGLKKEDIYKEPEIKSVAQIEKLIPKGKARFAFASDKKPAGDLSALTRKKMGQPTLAHGEDKRPALTLDAMQEFDDLTEGTELND